MKGVDLQYEFNNTPIPQDKFQCGEKIDFADIHRNLDQSPIFGFDYIKNDSSDYSFNSSFISINDYHLLINRLKLLSRFNIDYLFDKASHEYHLKFIKDKFPTKLKELIEDTMKIQLVPENTPLICEMALYTSPEGASRRTGVKSPRIFFFIGDGTGTVYLLYFDPFHELIPSPTYN